jgi:hypothetical protein
MAETIDVSFTVLEETPARALSFLMGIARMPVVAAKLATRGWNADTHEQGWQLLWTAAGYKKRVMAGALEGSAVAAAVAALDAWDETNFRISRAALESKFADQCAFLFDDLAPATGTGSIISVGKYVARLDALESGEGREKTRKADKAALQALAARGIGEDERKRLRELLETATSQPEIADDGAPAEEKRIEALRELRTWYREWSEVARALVTRRDHLITLGLARRKARKKAKPPAPAGGGGTGNP